MKHKILLFSLIPLFLLSCSPHKKEEKLCTMIFTMIQISIKDSLNNPVRLDSYEVRIIKTNQVLPVNTDSSIMAQGFYNLLTDSEIKYISGSGTLLRFMGFINNQDIVSAEYIADQDGCHVNLVSGPQAIIIE